MHRVALLMAIVVALAGVHFTHAEPPAGAAATVNGQVIPEGAVAAALKRFPDKAERDKARPEVLDVLIDNVLMDQYLVQQKLVVDKRDADARLAEIKKEIEKNGQTTFEKLLGMLGKTEAEFLAEVTADLRWEKFAIAQATDVNLKALFDQNPEMFNGSQVRARHILLSPKNPKDAEAARAELSQMRKLIEAKAAEALAKLPATADALTREQERQKQIELVFADLARDKSTCPSKRDGGDLNWFPRAGSMVETFAKAAFALKTFEISEPIQTQFGYHLILCTGRKPGQAVKFEDAKEEVRDVYCSRLRDYLVAQLRQRATIEIVAPK